jgi:hypothetical protein
MGLLDNEQSTYKKALKHYLCLRDNNNFDASVNIVV